MMQLVGSATPEVAAVLSHFFLGLLSKGRQLLEVEWAT